MLIIKIQNDSTGTVEVGNYRYQVMINETVIDSGNIIGHKRKLGWRKLVGELIEDSQSREYAYIREYDELLHAKGAE